MSMVAFRRRKYNRVTMAEQRASGTPHASLQAGRNDSGRIRSPSLPENTVRHNQRARIEASSQ